MYKNNQNSADEEIKNKNKENQKLISSMQSESTKSQIEELANKHYVSLNNFDSKF